MISRFVSRRSMMVLRSSAQTWPRWTQHRWELRFGMCKGMMLMKLLNPVTLLAPQQQAGCAGPPVMHQDLHAGSAQKVLAAAGRGQASPQCTAPGCLSRLLKQAVPAAKPTWAEPQCPTPAASPLECVRAHLSALQTSKEQDKWMSEAKSELKKLQVTAPVAPVGANILTSSNSATLQGRLIPASATYAAATSCSKALSCIVSSCCVLP